MPLIVIAGPERAGKTTLCRELEVTYGYTYRHWGHLPEGDKGFLPQLKQDVADARRGAKIVWDRGWPCEAVYARLLGRDRRAREDWWLMEWLYGRALWSVGIGAVLLPGNPEAYMRVPHRGGDLPVDPTQEADAYGRYAQRFKWRVLRNDYTREGTIMLAMSLDHEARAAWEAMQFFDAPPDLVGRPGSTALVVGDRRNDGSRVGMPGAWLPFTSSYTERFGRLVGDLAVDGTVAWTNAADCYVGNAARFRTVVVCGRSAEKWAESHQLGRFVDLVTVPHPAALYRWGNMAHRIDPVEKLIISSIGEAANADQQEPAGRSAGAIPGTGLV